MAKTRRSYTGASVSSTTSSAIAASGTTSFTVSAATNWPYGSDPFYVVLSPSTASEEKVLVTRTNTGDTTINIASDAVRGLDGTSAVSHDSGATVYPVFTAVDADEANELAAMWESKGDIVSHGTSTFSRLAVGTDAYVLKADSAAGSGLAWGQVDSDSIATNAVTALKIAAGAVGSSELAADAVSGDKIAAGAVGSTELAADAVTAAKIAAGAVGSTEIAADAVTNAKIVDGAVDTEHIANYALGRKTMFPQATWTWSAGSTIALTEVGVTESSDPDGITAAASSTRIKFTSTGLYFVEATSFGAQGYVLRGGNISVNFGNTELGNQPVCTLIYVSGTTNSDYIYIRTQGYDNNYDGLPDTSQPWDAGSLTIYKVIG